MISWNDVRTLGTMTVHELSRSWAGVVQCSKADIDAATSSLRSERVTGGGHVVTVDGARCRTAQGLFDAFEGALAFPVYFGSNWDAFDECLTDLLVLNDGGLGAEFGDRSGISAEHLVVIISDADLVLGLERDRRHEQRKFIAALRWAATGRDGADRQRGQILAELTVLFHSVPEAADALTSWLSEANMPHVPVLGVGR